MPNTPDIHANRFARTRSAHRAELGEDYVEVALSLIEETGEARLTDIAARVGVAHPTASKVLRRLETEGLVEAPRYRAVRLTGLGRQLALECRRRHRAVVHFLLTLGLDHDTAEIDAEGIEHHVSVRTLDALETFVREHGKPGESGDV